MNRIGDMIWDMAMSRLVLMKWSRDEMDIHWSFVWTNSSQQMHMWKWEYSSTWITQIKCELGYHGLGRYDIGERIKCPSGSDGWVWS